MQGCAMNKGQHKEQMVSNKWILYFSKLKKVKKINFKGRLAAKEKKSLLWTGQQLKVTADLKSTKTWKTKIWNNMKDKKSSNNSEKNGS